MLPFKVLSSGTRQQKPCLSNGSQRSALSRRCRCYVAQPNHDMPGAMDAAPLATEDLSGTPAAVNGSTARKDETSLRQSLQLQVLNAVAGTDRGASASVVRHRKIRRLLEDLQELNPCTDAFTGAPPALNGAWELVYSTAETFRSSPFFWAFQKAIDDIDMAGVIFAFTDSIPGATIGKAEQHIEVETSSLVSRVDMTVYPGISGTVVTTSTLTGSGCDMKVIVLDTKVDNSIFSPVLDRVVVPVKELLERMRGSGVTTVGVKILYLDEDFRIVETDDGQIFMYTRPL